MGLWTLELPFKNNVKKAWWSKFAQQSKYNVGIDAAYPHESRDLGSIWSCGWPDPPYRLVRAVKQGFVGADKPLKTTFVERKALDFV